MRRLIMMMAALLPLVLSAQTFTFTSADSQTKNGVTVSVSKSSGSTPPAVYDNGLRLYAQNVISVSGAGLQQIRIYTVKQGKKDFATLSASVAGMVSGGSSTGANDTIVDTWNGNANQVDFTLGSTGQRVLVKLIVGERDSTSVLPQDSTQITPKDSVPTGLDNQYVYSEPTLVTNSDSLGSNITYSFVQNNILVQCDKGARTGSYFSCNAGQRLTFTATQPILAVAIDGYVKKDFAATSSAGSIEYVNAEEDAVEANPVLIVKNINATSVQIDCVKQLRCYSVAFYFSANPDIELGKEEGEYSYEWEDTTKVTLNLVFDEIESGDMSEDLGYTCSYISLANNDYEMELDVFAALEPNGLPAAGTYPINDTYAANTVMASPGGTDEFDFPSALFGDFFEEGGEWYYNSVYYLVGGTLEIANVAGGCELRLTATSYYGSAIKTTYLVEGSAVEQITTEGKARKSFENGHIIIQRGEQKYSLLGQSLE